MNRISRKLVIVAGVLLVLTGATHIIGHFIASRASEQGALIQTAMSIYHVRLLGGEMSISEVINGLNVMYGLFLALLGLIAATLARKKMFPLGVSLIYLAGMAGGAAVSCVYFTWLHVAYYMVFAILFGMAALTRRLDQAS